MPTRTPVTKFPVPWRGVLPDTNEFSVPPDACIEAENVLFMEGALRCRPAWASGGSAPLPNISSQTVLSATQWESDYDTESIVAATRSTWLSHSSVSGDSWIDLGEVLVSTGGGAVWDVHDTNIYKASFDMAFKRLWVNGVMGAPKNSIATLATNKDWFWDEEDKLIYLYDDTNDPDTYNSPGVAVGDELTASINAPTVFRTFDMGNLTYLLGTNGTDEPKYWDGKAQLFRDFDGGAPAARAMVISANRCVLLGAGGDRLLIDVSDFNDFRNGYGTVQQTLLGDTPGEIITGLELNDLQHIIYKSDAIYRGVAQAEFYGVATPFRYEAVATSIPGPVSPLAIKVMPDGRHIYIGQDGGLHIFDGVRPVEVGSAVRRYLSQRWDYDSRSLTFLHLDNEKRLLWICYPRDTGSAIVRDRALVLNLDVQNERGEYSMWPVYWGEIVNLSSKHVYFMMPATTKTRETIGDGAGHTIGSSHESIGSGYLFSDTTLIFYEGIAGATATAAFDWDTNLSYNVYGEAYVLPGWSDLGDPTRWKTVHEIEYLVRHETTELVDNAAIEVQLKSRDYGEDVTSSSAVSSKRDDEPRTVQYRQSGRWFTARVELGNYDYNKFLTVLPIHYLGAMVMFTPRGRR